MAPHMSLQGLVVFILMETGYLRLSRAAARIASRKLHTRSVAMGRLLRISSCLLQPPEAVLLGLEVVGH